MCTPFETRNPILRELTPFGWNRDAIFDRAWSRRARSLASFVATARATASCNRVVTTNRRAYAILPVRSAGIEDLRTKREEIQEQISTEEEEKAKVQNDLTVLSKRLSTLNDSIARKVAARTDYDKTIQETEAAYNKILESSMTLLTVLKRESVGLEKKGGEPVPPAE